MCRLWHVRQIAVAALLAALAILGWALAGSAQDETPDAPDLPPNAPSITYGFTLVVSGLNQPVFVTYAGDARLLSLNAPA